MKSEMKEISWFRIEYKSKSSFQLNLYNFFLIKFME